VAEKGAQLTNVSLIKKLQLRPFVTEQNIQRHPLTFTENLQLHPETNSWRDSLSLHNNSNEFPLALVRAKYPHDPLLPMWSWTINKRALVQVTCTTHPQYGCDTRTLPGDGKW